MLVQRAMKWRLDRSGLFYVNELLDMANAFGSCDRDVMVQAA